jgi:hypothetical protein
MSMFSNLTPITTENNSSENSQSGAVEYPLKKGDTLLVSHASLIPIVKAMLSEEEDKS